MWRLEVTRLGQGQGQDGAGQDRAVDRNDLSSLVVPGMLGLGLSKSDPCWETLCSLCCVMCNASFETSSLAVKKI